MPGDQTAQGSPSLRHGTGARRVSFETAPVLFLVSILEPQLPVSLFAGIRQPVIPDDLCRPVAASTLRSESVRDAGQENAHRRQPLLTVDHADRLYHARRHPRLRERQECTPVVCGIGAGRSDRQEILNQPFDVGLTPTVPTLPPWHDVLDGAVEQLKKLNVLSLHGTPVRTSAPSESALEAPDVRAGKKARASVSRRSSTPGKVKATQTQTGCSPRSAAAPASTP